MGKVKTDSNVSLVAGIASGLVALYSLYISQTTPVLGVTYGLFLSLLMSGVFISRFVRTRKFMPAGLILVLSVITAALLAVVRNQMTEAAVPESPVAVRQASETEC